ncbi:MAG: hypothetical protein Q4P71_00120 [Actinomycetaceae bacterium]|nr:hypothetical protein [Actinomycetaceae bacterium]
MENPNLISASAIRSALKVLYSPGLTIDSPIGLRNDPHTATILECARNWNTEFDSAVMELPPMEKREYLQWSDTADGQAFSTWKKRAFAMAGALDILERAWYEQEIDEIEIDPRIQRLVDQAWWYETRGHWFAVGAALAWFIAFFGTGPSTGMLASWIRAIGYGLAGVLALGWVATKIIPTLINARVGNVGIPSAMLVAQESDADVAPMWADGNDMSCAKILNYANWVMLAMPTRQFLMDLTPPTALDSDNLNERQREIVGAAQKSSTKYARKR